MAKTGKYLKKQDHPDRRLPLPGWAFLMLTVLYNEGMLHVWVSEEFSPGRMAVVALFALGFGGVLALLSSLLPSAKAAKRFAVALAAVVNVLWLTMYFISDAYRVFMTPATILNGAGGVAQDYFGLVMSLLGRNLWRIALILAPTVVYGIFCRGSKPNWKLRAALTAATVAAYLAGLGAVYGLTEDWGRMSRTYDFDSAVRCFGLSMAFTLEGLQGARQNEEPDFVMPPADTQPTQATESTQPAESTQETQPPVVYGEHLMEGVDFAQLAEAADNNSVKNIYQYLAALEPGKENAYTGLFAGKNLILITAEAFASQVIDPERTPTLYRLANNGILFTDYYQPAWGASTTGGEFSNLVGMVPTTGGMCMKELKHQNMFLTMGKQLQKLGYTSIAYHNHLADFYDRDETHTLLGYDEYKARFGGLEGITPVWPESDLEMIDITVPEYIQSQPFSIYYMTVSGHCVYSQNENAMSKKNYHLVEDMDASETVKCYHASQMELELAMESLVSQLEEAGIADDTVIVIATDHYPYGLERSSAWNNSSNYLAELYGVEEYDKFIRDKSALIIWSGSIEGENLVVDEPVSSLDILPTLSNLFGVEYDSRLLPGRDALSDEQPLVFWMDKSWRTEKGTYNTDGRGEFIPAQGQSVDQDYIDRISAIVANKLTYCSGVMNTDFFDHLEADIAESE